jgi:Flp pilus assembly protein TadG
MRGFWRNEEGGITLLSALTMPVLLGIGAFAVDLGMLRYNAMRLQIAADAGAVAGVRQLPDPTKAVQTAVTLANLNAPPNAGQVTLASDVELVVYDASTKTYRAADANTPANAVRVTASRDAAHQNRVLGFFSRFAGSAGPFSLSAHSVAIMASDGDDGAGSACLYALDPTNSDTLTIAGSTTVKLSCAARAKSSSATAISSNGNAAQMTATTICQTAAPSQSPRGYSPAVNKCGSPTTDPLAAVTEPTPSNCKAGGTLRGTLTSGCYTGSTTFRGSVTLAAGTYYFQGASVKIASNASISGSGVTLFLDANSSLSITGTPSISLTAPSSGSLTGIVLFQSRSASGASLSISGNSTTSLDGVLYAPATSVTFTGNGTTTNPARYGSVIASQVHFTGNSAFAFGATLPSGPGNTHSALVN